MKSKINSFEAACKSEGLNPKDLPIVNKLPEEHQEAMVSIYKLTIIIQARNRELNGGERWYPNWNDFNERKYYYWPEIEADEKRPSGFGFARSYYVSSFSSSIAGFRLCLKTSEAALACGKDFPKLYMEFFLYMGLYKAAPKAKKKKK